MSQIPSQGLDTVSSRLDSMRPARTVDDRWAPTSADDTYSNYEYEYDDRLPKEKLEELVARSQNVLKGLKKDNDSQSCYEFEDASEYEYEYESDYGPPGGPIGRMPSRRFGSKALRLSKRRHSGDFPRSLTIPEPVVTAPVVPGQGVGQPRRLPSIRPLSIRRVSRTTSSASRTRPARQQSMAGPHRKTTVRRGLSTRRARMNEHDSFEESLARMSQTPIGDLPDDLAPEHRPEGPQRQEQPYQQASSHPPYQPPHQHRSQQPQPYRQQPQQPSRSIANNTSDNQIHHNYNSRRSSDQFRGSPPTHHVGPTLGRHSSSYHRRLDEKSRAFASQGEMVEIPIVDDDGTREMNTSRNRALSINSMNPEQPLPPYAAAPPNGHRGVPNGSRAVGDAAEEDQTPKPTEEEEGAMVHGLKLVSIILALALAVFVVGMDVNIIATAIPHITKDFNSLGDIAWYGSAFLMTSCAFQILFGRLYTHFPLKWVFSSALFVFELGSLIAGISPNSILLIIGRAVQGIGAGGILSGALIIGSLIVPLSKRPLMGGVIGAMEGVAMISAPIIGGTFTDHLNWRWCFYINLPIGAVVIVIVIFCLRVPVELQPAPDMSVPDSDIPVGELTFWQKTVLLSKKLDLLGTSLLVPAIIAALLALQWGGSKYDWNSLGIIALFVIAIAFFGIFCYFQHQKQDLAMVPPRIFKQRTVLAGFWFMLCTSSALVVMTYFLPLWFQVILNVSPSNSGTRLVPMLVGVIVGVLLSGALVSVTGYYAPFMILGTIMMSVGSGLLSTWTPTTTNALLIAFPAIFGAGCGIAFQQPIIAAQAVLKDEDIPIGISVIVFGQSIGAALVLSVAETVFSNRLRINVADQTGVAVDHHTLTDGGAAGVIKAVTSAGGSLVQLMNAYNKAITQAFYVSVAMAGLSIFGALAIEWRNVKREEERRKREAELLKTEKEEQERQKQRGTQGSLSNSNPSYPHNQTSMAYNFDRNQHTSYEQQQQQQCFEMEADRPQPYDQAGSRMGSPYRQPGSRMGSPHGFTHQQFTGTDGEKGYYSGPVAGPGPYPSPFEMQQTSRSNHPGLGLNAGYYNAPDSQGPAPSYHEKAPPAGR